MFAYNRSHQLQAVCMYRGAIETASIARRRARVAVRGAFTVVKRPKRGPLLDAARSTHGGWEHQAKRPARGGVECCVKSTFEGVEQKSQILEVGSRG